MSKDKDKENKENKSVPESEETVVEPVPAAPGTEEIPDESDLTQP